MLNTKATVFISKPHFKQRSFVLKYKLIADHQRYEAAAFSIRKGLLKCTLIKRTERFEQDLPNLVHAEVRKTR